MILLTRTLNKPILADKILNDRTNAVEEKLNSKT